MKHLIIAVFLVCTTNIYSQNIESDPLFLKYENEYHNGALKKLDFNLYEGNLSAFAKSFKDAKAIMNFNKSKDKNRWMQKNLDKTNFSNIGEAMALYNSIIDFEAKQKEASVEITQLNNELEKKYSGKEIFAALKMRYEKK